MSTLLLCAFTPTLRDRLQQVSSVVEMTEDAPEGVKVTWTAYCNNENNEPLPPTKSRTCENVGIGEEVHFEATIEVSRPTTMRCVALLSVQLEAFDAQIGGV